MRHDNATGQEVQAILHAAGQLPVLLGKILRVADDGMPDMRQVRPQLVGAAGHRFERDPGELARGGVDHGVIGHRMARPLLAVARDAHERIVRPRLLGKERRDASLGGLRYARDQRPVDFSGRAGAKGLGQRRGREPRLGDEQTAGGIFIEAMDNSWT